MYDHKGDIVWLLQVKIYHVDLFFFHIIKYKMITKIFIYSIPIIVSISKLDLATVFRCARSNFDMLTIIG